MSTPPVPSLADALAELALRLDPAVSDTVLAVLHELVAASQAGHVCLPFAHRPERPALRASPLVCRPGGYAPLVLDEAGRLYLARHWYDEVRLAERLAQLARDQWPVNEAALIPLLDALFPQASPQPQPDRQKLAAALAARQRLLILSGGPGTGKTTTVVRLMAVLASLSSRPLVMAMAAPTGKAAARLSESVSAARDRLPVSDSVRRSLPATAQTLHRLIGLFPGAGRPRHHAGNPLPVDVLVIDEASMIDLSLMARTLDALPAHARLILLGDRDQLASVEAGAVLGDLCQRVAFRPETLAWLERVAGPLPALDATDTGRLTDAVMLLTHSHRFAAGSGIGEMARRVNEGDGAGVLDLLAHPPGDDIGWERALPLEVAWQAHAPYWAALAQGTDPAALAQALSRFMVLAAERREVAAFNRAIEARLEGDGHKRTDSDHYPGRPVMITENDYGVGLFNGDIGFVVQRPEGLRVAFADGPAWREIAPGRLPAHETVFAMTVHKSQGSEFDAVLLVLPETAGAQLDRALVYTALTRARRHFRVLGSPEVLRAAIESRPARFSGLAERLA